MMPSRGQKGKGVGGQQEIGCGVGKSLGPLPSPRSVLPCDFLGGPASSPEVMEEEVEDEDFLPLLSLFDFLVSFFRFPAKLLFPPLQESLLGSVVVGMCTG